MAKDLKVPILGIVENMSYIQCHDCDRKIRLFGESKVEKLAEKYGVPLIGEVPLDPLNAGSDELPADGKSLIISAVRDIATRIVAVVGDSR
jgi:ATP-binding protein involved in chromosome partitioning